MISRHWKGIVKVGQTDEYVRHLTSDTFKLLEKIPGFISAKILRRTVSEGVEFLIITEWINLDSVKQFAGDGLDVAVVPPVARAMMVRFDETVVHYEVNHQTGIVN